MNTIILACLMALGLSAVCNVALAAEEEDFRTDINPALRYYQVMVRGPEFSQDDRDYLLTNEWRGQKLPERFVKLVSPLDSYMKELQRAGKATVPCDWGIDMSPGPMTLLPQLAHCKSLARFARLHAMWELQEGRESDARDDLIAAFALGRNTSRDGTLIAVLVELAIEDIVLNTVAENFHSFTPETLQRLAAGFDAAPAQGTASMAVSSAEEAFIHNWLEQKIRRWQKKFPGDDAKVMAAYRDLIRDLGKGSENAGGFDAILNASENSEGLLKLLEEGKSQVEKLSQILSLPHPAFEEQSAQFQNEVEKSNNPFMKLSFPSILKARPKELRMDIKYAMFRAAVAYKLRGEPGLKEVNDPTGQRPFHFERFIFEGKDRGFKLTSAYSGNGYPETQIFVESDGKPFVCAGPKAGEPVGK